jgi:GxxExxY protein
MNQITERIIGCAFTVSSTLGCGFLEKVYENALAIEVRKSGLNVEQQKPFVVMYDGAVAGDYLADMVVENLTLVELKAVKEFDDIHAAQCLNYLKASVLPICLLMNFGKPKVEIKRYLGPNANIGKWNNR